MIKISIIISNHHYHYNVYRVSSFWPESIIHADAKNIFTIVTYIIIIIIIIVIIIVRINKLIISIIARWLLV